MKAKLFLLLFLVTSVWSCKKFDDSHLWDSINSLNGRVERLEDVCDRMNTNISSLQMIVQALENNDAVTSVSSLPDASGYTITFASGKVINIYNGTDGTDGKDGEDGKDGQNGQDGTDGQDGKTPIISVRQDTDGIYYWTVDGEWLIVDGQKVKAAGMDGKDGINGQDGEDGKDGADGKPGADGTNGKDGITPQFKIENGYWYISYDNEVSWEQLGKATGDNGLNGADGESFFKGVSIENGYVCFILNDENFTTIKLPFIVENSLIIDVGTAGTLNDLTTTDQYNTITSLKITGEINDDDLKCIHARFIKLEYLDIGEAIYSGQNYVNPWKNLVINRTINTIILPNQEIQWNCDYMQNLETIYVTNGATIINGHITLECAPYVKHVHYKEGISTITGGVPHPKNCHVYYPSTLTEIDSYIFVCKNASCRNIQISACTIYAENPPAVSNTDGFVTRVESYPIRGKINCILYVPKESIDLYKNANGWQQFQTILPIEE